MPVSLTNLSTILAQVSKYLIIILMMIYTVQCYTVFRYRTKQSQSYVFTRQNVSMFIIHFVAYLIMFLDQQNIQIAVFYVIQLAYLLLSLLLLTHLYPKSSRLLVNNMLMLIAIGLIMITRLTYASAVRQFEMEAVGTVLALIIPVIVRKAMGLTKLTWFYVFVGLGLLALVLVAARSTYGAKLSLSIHGFTFQPSEFVKIIFVFAVAGLLSGKKDRKRIIIATALAAAHVLILVASTDLGSALIFFITYLVMLFAATRNPFLVLSGVVAGILAAVLAYFMFAHVRVRVQVWLDPFSDYAGTGYQVSQSLFSIAAGGWFGTGLGQGSPTAIPVVQQDFMFSAICEELGGIFAICLILVCLSCFIMFINIAMKLENRFYRLVALGLGSTYAVQCFLTVGGDMKMIPMTGVTLPLVSYGGSSALATIVTFSIVQGLYTMRRDEEDKDEEEKYGQYGSYGQYPDDGYGPYGQKKQNSRVDPGPGNQSEFGRK